MHRSQSPAGNLVSPHILVSLWRSGGKILGTKDKGRKKSDVKGIAWSGECSDVYSEAAGRFIPVSLHSLQGD